jgi:histidine triad (HIT) family protein
MDVMPQAPGHTLLIPKYATEDIFNLPEDYFIHLMGAKQRIAKAIKNAYEPTGVMIMQLNGKEAGQTVFHLHFHIIPRKEGLNYKFHSSEIVNFKELEKEAEKIKEWL